MTHQDITRNGLWTNNIALVQLLGLCPLLAVTNTTVNGIGLGLATYHAAVVEYCGIAAASFLAQGNSPADLRSDHCLDSHGDRARYAGLLS